LATREFLSYLDAAVPPEKKTILTDLFETITLYDLKTTEVKTKRHADGKFEVRVIVDAKKFHSDGKGRETETPLNDWIEIGVLGKKKENGQDNILALEKIQIRAARTEFSFVVDQEPEKAGIDPLNKMIDRNPDDNTKPAF